MPTDTQSAAQGLRALPEYQEILELQRRAEAQTAELRELLKQQSAEADQRAAEADQRAKELDERMDKRNAEVVRSIEKTEEQLRKSEGEFTSKWGRLMESLVEGDLVPLLAQRGIDVTDTGLRRKSTRNGERMEIDIVAANGEDVVAVEVKTTLRPKHVKRFREKLGRFLDFFPVHRGQRIYGAVAYLTADSEADVHAENKGLFIIRATGDSATIVNAPDFQPRRYA